MITFKELLKRAENKKVAIHTPTKEQAKTLLKMLDEKGYTWLDGDKLTTETYYEKYEDRICYALGIDAYGNLLNKKVVFGLLEFYQDKDYTIIEFSEIDFKEEQHG